MSWRKEIPSCKVCGQPASRSSSDYKYGKYCSTRCRMVGTRFFGLAMFFVLIAGVIIGSFLGPATGDWFTVIICGVMSPFPLIVFIMGVKYKKEGQIKRNHPNAPRYIEATNVCPNCSQQLPSESKICIYCGYSLGKETIITPTETSTSLCQYCGSEVKANSKFCSNCGNLFSKN